MTTLTVVSDPAAKEKAQQLVEYIQTKAKSLGGHLASALKELDPLIKLVINAHKSKAWRDLGHESWAQLCSAEFGSVRMLKLPTEYRRELHKRLKAAKLSLADIHAVSGSAINTIQVDLAYQIDTDNANELSPTPNAGTSKRKPSGKPSWRSSSVKPEALAKRIKEFARTYELSPEETKTIDAAVVVLDSYTEGKAAIE
jgi:hypothetical protein